VVHFVDPEPFEETVVEAIGGLSMQQLLKQHLPQD
jgi:hypothetical protein